MNIILYKNTIPLDNASRTLNDPITISGHLRDGSGVYTPTIEVELRESLLTGYNFAYIPKYGRYYYFTEPPRIERGAGLMVLIMEVDVLYTYRTFIMNSECIALRSSSHFNMELPDSAISEENRWIYHSGVLPFSFTPNHGTYVLSVTGG